MFDNIECKNSVDNYMEAKHRLITLRLRKNETRNYK